MKAEFKIETNSKDKLKHTHTLIIILKIILLLYLALIAFPYRFSPITPGLDPSWAFAINYFFDKHIIFGKDVICPYGPLGFISMPLNVGSNLDIATVFQLSLWIIFSALIAYLALKNFFSLLQLSLFVLLFSGGQALYYFGYIGYDYFIDFLIVLFLSLAFFMKRWQIFYISALLLSVLVMFIKCSSLIFAAVSVVSFIFASAFVDKKKALKAAVLSLSVPVLFVVFYMIYHPSFSSLISYIKGTYELISGNSVAMSISGKRVELFLAFIAFVLYSLLMLLLLRARERSFFLSIMFVGPLFVAFKHGFVRQDTHTMIFFSILLFIVGLVILFTDLRKFFKRSVFLISALVVLWFSVYLQYTSSPSFLLKGIAGLITFNNIKATLQYSQTKKFLEAVTREALQPQKLPEDLLEKIGTESIGIFPWEVSYVAANDLNYKPFPVFQTENAYTSYLDFLNAKYLENRIMAPELILMEWKAVDGRHPLIHAPAMWLSIYKWYDAYDRNNEILLLKRRSTPRFNDLELVNRRIYSKKEIIELPVTDNPLIVKIPLKLNTLGKLSKLFFRVDEVRMKLFMESGRTEDYRIIPDTLKDGLFINFLPVSLSGVNALLSSDKTERIKGFKIDGKGFHLYNKEMTIEFYRIPSLMLKPNIKFTYNS
jgi:hypothetical protein